MRRTLFMLFVLVTAWTVVPVASALAQAGGGDQDESDADKKKKKDEWELKQAPLPGRKNAGPCPYVKVLYDAARYEEFKDNQEASGSAAYTGEIQDITSDCEYKASEPIKVKMDVKFAFGRGPEGKSAHKTFTYWVAVTHRNREVLAKQEFQLPVDFPAGQDRVGWIDHIKEIVIPRADRTVAGDNFEVLIGFDVTPELASATTGAPALRRKRFP